MQPDGWEGEGIAPHLLRRRGERINGAGLLRPGGPPGPRPPRALPAPRARRAAREQRPHRQPGDPPRGLVAGHPGRPVRARARSRRPAWPGRCCAPPPRSSRWVTSAPGTWRPRVPRMPTQVEEGLDPAPLAGIARPASARDWLWNSALVGWKGLPLLLDAYRAGRRRRPLPPGLLRRAPRRPSRRRGAAGAGAPRESCSTARPPISTQIRARCLVYVHTALRPEPFGRSLLEAMAAGLCPIVPDAGTPGRLVRHEENGLVYPAGSVEGLDGGAAPGRRRSGTLPPPGSQVRRGRPGLPIRPGVPAGPGRTGTDPPR